MQEIQGFQGILGVWKHSDFIGVLGGSGNYAYLVSGYAPLFSYILSLCRRWNMKKCRIDEDGRECFVCGVYKAWEEYNKNRQSKWGRDNRCRECTKAWRNSDEYRKANRERAKRDYADPVKKEKQVERMREYRDRPDVETRMNSESFREMTRKWARKWRAKLTEKQREKRKESRQKSQRKRMINPVYKLSSVVSSDIRKRLKSRGISKGRKHWEDLLGYRVDALKAHLESLFETGMTWENHSLKGWHIDHIIPVSLFEFNSMDNPEFKRCWALGNLAPRWATTDIARKHGSCSVGNINKSDKLPE